MTDSVGSTETRHERHPVRAEGRRAEGRHHERAGVAPTPSCSTTNFEPVEPGSGKVGLLARGGNIPLGYYNDPVKTAETFVTDAQGRRWSIPGDFARVEADGRITLLGRGSVSINSGGEKIYPEEVEGALKSHPDVFDVLVVGVPDERWGERVCALLQPRPGRTPELDELARALPDPHRGLQDPAPAAARRRGPAPAQRQARLPVGQGAGTRPGRRSRARPTDSLWSTVNRSGPAQGAVPATDRDVAMTPRRLHRIVALAALVALHVAPLAASVSTRPTPRPTPRRTRR